ncbi:unnamed protein product [Thelazia callipaeda]|uniref:non-specific serine/threonine protein kinase n=1 Tax=Thelazia callipaeda TaxID=103827 RepID=A0A0N5CL42_THECL|nr:unnamed protein product [Thelazia callipaeda]
METTLLLEAKHLRDNRRTEAASLPVVIDHFYHHMSCTNFFILEYYSHGSLENLLAKIHPIPLHRQHMAKIIHGVAMGIYFLHTQSIYHGNICTANILVDEQMNARLSGFSKAQEVTPNMNANTQLPTYAAPECLDPKAAPLPQDMFAIGIVLYRCMIGHMPKRKANNGGIDFSGLKESLSIPIDPKIWCTTQLLVSEHTNMRQTAGQLLHTSWIEDATKTPLTQLFNWDT